MAIFWIFIFAVSVSALVKGADWLLESSEKMGFALGLSPFSSSPEFQGGYTFTKERCI